MGLVTLKHVLIAAESKSVYAMGLVCQGWEDSRAYVEAGALADAPVILSAGPGARRNMPIALWGQMFQTLAQQSHSSVVAHLDHGQNLTDVKQALDAGFTSVMFDGSALPIQENIALTQQVIDIAKRYGASVEAEVGMVGYENGIPSEGTTVAEVKTFAAECPVDALAISVGNLHLQTQGHAKIHWDRLADIEAVSSIPLVLHGGSGIKIADRHRLARQHRVRKMNVGTEFRQRYGQALRKTLANDPAIFDRTEIMLTSVSSLRALAVELLMASWHGDV